MNPIAETLPVMEIAGKVNEALRANPLLVVTAPPGAGKSTLLPLTILEGLNERDGGERECAGGRRIVNERDGGGEVDGGRNNLEYGGKILMLEPRRLAARQVARRMAFLLGEEVGGTVGYRIRFETKVSARTRIEVITEGILTRMLLDDPTMDGVSVLIFDEFHERSLASDEALALARESQKLIRPDLRILIMSATIDTAAVRDALGKNFSSGNTSSTAGKEKAEPAAMEGKERSRGRMSQGEDGEMVPLIESRGKSFPVEIRYSDRDTDPRNCAEEVAREVAKALRREDGDILAFLPGEAEIRRCADLLTNGMDSGFLPDGMDTGPRTSRISICPLYGMLPFEQQNKAIAPSAEGERKVVLATSIAETSLTIEGVRVVIDSGLHRTQVYSPQNGQSHLETLMVSRDMADQRAGRAGRVAPGICYRLYRESSERSMKASRVPEILEADLLPLALDLAVWGEEDAMNLPWVTPPEAWKIAQARSVLQSLGAVGPDGCITAEGRRMAKYPCHPRLAKMLESAAGEPVRACIAADLAAIIEDRDPLSSSDAGVDIDLRVSALREARRKGNQRWARTLRAAEQYRRLVQAPEDNSEADPAVEGMLLAAAYPERTGRLDPEGCGRYTLASGDRVFIDHADEMSVNEWIVAVSANVDRGSDGRVFLASKVEKADLLRLASAADKVAWNSKEGCLTAAREWRAGGLLVDSKPISDIPQERISEVICEAARKQGMSMFDFSDAVANLQRRVAAVASWHPELSLPDLSTETVLDRAGEWLPLYIGRAKSVTELKKIDMEQVLWGMLDYVQQQNVDSLAPSHIEVPTGSRIRVEYRQGADAPVLRVRLQECFGLTETPRVDGGARPVLMELLSPGFKPVQLTQDLASFWSGTYFEVRKELRRRYPKHSWPDNPLEAPAVRGIRRK